MMKIAIFASGNGSNFEVLAKKIQTEKWPVTLAFLFCNHPDAPVVKKAEKLQVPVLTFSPKDFSSKAEYEEKILERLAKEQVDFILLAGYLQMIGKTLLKAYPKRIINLHPSLLPKYKGLHGIEEAFQAKETITGVTIHYVDEILDNGPIIAQSTVPITKEDTLKSLEEKIHRKEHLLYPQVLKELIFKEATK